MNKSLILFSILMPMLHGSPTLADSKTRYVGDFGFYPKHQSQIVDDGPVQPRSSLSAPSHRIPDEDIIYDLPGIGRIEPWIGSWMDRLSKRILSNWEPGDSKLPKMLSFSVDADGSFSNIKIIKNATENDAQAEFACIEAVSETSRFLPNSPGEQLEYTFKNSKKLLDTDCAATFRRTHAIARDEVVWHLIPIEAIHVIDNLDPKIVHSDRNMRVIKAGLENSEQIQKARLAWIQFLRSQKKISIKQLRVKAADIEKSCVDVLKSVAGPNNN